jgi:hypothetical protein
MTNDLTPALVEATARDTEATVRRDADPACTICRGVGWHYGWNLYGDPVRLRYPCVDQRRLGGTERNG